MTVNLSTGNATGEGTDSISAVEDVSGSPFGDTLTGSGAENFLSGGGGKDKLYGRNANDHLTGGDGNDLLRGEGGYDTLVGAGGTDDCNVGPGGGQMFTCDLNAFMSPSAAESSTTVRWDCGRFTGRSSWSGVGPSSCLAGQSSLNSAPGACLRPTMTARPAGLRAWRLY